MAWDAECASTYWYLNKLYVEWMYITVCVCVFVYTRCVCVFTLTSTCQGASLSRCMSRYSLFPPSPARLMANCPSEQKAASEGVNKQKTCDAYLRSSVLQIKIVHVGLCPQEKNGIWANIRKEYCDILYYCPEVSWKYCKTQLLPQGEGRTCLQYFSRYKWHLPQKWSFSSKE